MQKRAIRIIAFADRLAHTEPLFEELKILNMSKIYIYCAQLFMFKNHHKDVPSIFHDFYRPNREIHSIGTRQSNLMHVDVRGPKTEQPRRTIRIKGVQIYNYFSSRLDLDCTFVTYKKHLKYFLLNNDISCLLDKDK